MVRFFRFDSHIFYLKSDLLFCRDKGKRTPKKVSKQGRKGASKSNNYELEEKESSDVSDLEPTMKSKVDEMNSGK